MFGRPVGWGQIKVPKGAKSEYRNQENPGLNKSALVDLAAPQGIGQKDARAALAKMENDPRVRVEEGARRAKLYYQAYDPVEEAAF